MIKIDYREVQQIRLVLNIANEIGYGNLISHLKAAWALELIENYGMTEDKAVNDADTSIMDLRMHEDIVNRGQFDETGQSYISLELKHGTTL